MHSRLKLLTLTIFALTCAEPSVAASATPIQVNITNESSPYSVTQILDFGNSLEASALISAPAGKRFIIETVGLTFDLGRANPSPGLIVRCTVGILTNGNYNNYGLPLLTETGFMPSVLQSLVLRQDANYSVPLRCYRDMQSGAASVIMSISGYLGSN